MTQRSQCAESELLFNKQGTVQHVTLNRPHALNAVNLQMVRDLTNKLKQWLHDPNTSVITLRGAGEKAFCAGGDLKSITFSARDGGNYGQHFFFEEFTLNYIIGTYPKPFISILNGITFGGAAGLTVIGKLCVATERTLFCMPECAIGLFPDVGSGHFLSRLPDNLGLFLGLTGHKLTGADIVSIGLASHYIDYDQISQLEQALEGLGPKVEVDDVYNILSDLSKNSETIRHQPATLEKVRGQISKCFRGDSVEEIVENLHLEGSDWAQKQLAAIHKMSPTSLKITFRLLKEGMTKTLSQTLQTEYRLTQRCIQDKDFHEGIRAAILDKDRSPQWNPARLEDVTDERLNHYFSPIGQGRELILNAVLS